MQDKKYYYDEQIKNYFYKWYIDSFFKVKGNLEDTNLKSLLLVNTKQKLIEIAKRIEIRGYSKLGKESLVMLISDNIKANLPSLLGDLTYKEIKFLQALCNEDINEYKFNIEELNLIGGLNSLGILAKLSIDNNLNLVIAKEAKEPLKEIFSNQEYMESLKERSKGIAYIDGLMIHYGMVDGSELYRLISESNSSFLNKADLDFYLNYIFRSYEAFPDANAIIHPFVLDPKNIFAEINVRQNITYSYENSDYFIALGEGLKLSFSKEAKILREILLKNNIEEKKVDLLIIELIFYIKNEIGTLSIVNLLEDRGVVFNDETKESNELVAAVAELYNTTAIWTLKGLTPIELEERGKTVVYKEKKTGRNEPCPCGSGKKYKKCCGK
ncbi:SEC-C metal-binding domain-containing protein [Clostridium sp. SHJSY1]|uniref:YecA family protein n=1 Tax=Clostridium sp. SHJSY1 TaxID=2942483 RepID=UPI00287468B3|nr:SEC-C metal-binding domain-containing protein [Clostridium sp. SHJSY1]MDS0524579.1 SEC-C metal-binding domain-containing protein [Clostridium sp. SHJSY1]